jgi:formimidoylglutamate deiminase
MPDPLVRAYEPDLLYVDGAFRTSTALVVGPEGVLSIGPAPQGVTRHLLPGTAILPGLVNAHSHAFQRTLRGRAEHRVPFRESDDFWSWREEMYAAALALTPDDLFAASRMAFTEMVLSGITSVGEFHYLHRDPSGRPYGDPNLLEKRVIDSAAAAGLRIVLFRVAYERSGFNVEPNPRQVRFLEGADDFSRNLEALATELPRDNARVRLGVAPHSVRAVPRESLRRHGERARSLHLPLHLHAAEQPLEVDACLAESGRRPVELVSDLGLLCPDTTLVHAIHLNDAEVAAIGQSRTNVCACPTTERNLGDGIVPADALLAAGAALCLGTDSQATIDLLEDARELELHLRLLRLRRAVLDVKPRLPSEESAVAPGGASELDRSSLARRLFACATTGGARSLGLPVGALAPGAPADFMVVSLDDPSIAGASADDLLPAVVFGMARSAVRSVFVGGEEVVRDGRHRQQEETVGDFAALQRKLWGNG